MLETTDTKDVYLMGMYLGVHVVYGVAWDGMPALSYLADDGQVETTVEPGEPVGPDGLLMWTQHGHLGGDPEYALRVWGLGTRMAGSARYAARVPVSRYADRTDYWDAVIRRYCRSVGLELDAAQQPGWLALASWG